MQKVTVKNLGELNRLVAETREKMPDFNTVQISNLANCELRPLFLCAEWEFDINPDADFVGWQPRHNYTSDMNAAMVLLMEMPEPSCWLGNDGSWSVRWFKDSCWTFTGDTLARTICLAWLAWKGIEAVMSND